MADYRDKWEEWQRAARRKARELDEKYSIKERVEEGTRAAQEAAQEAAKAAQDAAKVAQDAAKRSAETLNSGADRMREEAARFSDDYEVRERARRAAEEAARRAREASEAFRQAAGAAGEKAGEAFSEAKNYYERAAGVFDIGARFTRVSVAATTGLFKTRDWIKENPGRAALITFSLVGGVRLGASFPGLDAVLLGAHPHWLTHSALPVYVLRKAGEKFDAYLRERESLIARGELSEAEQRRAEFERAITKYVGAPLLGAFSCAAGAAMWMQIFQPGRITGAPISWLLGGNPFLDGIWLFSNGVVCFHQGYKFFMIALADQQEVARVVREIKALLPA
jgi:flagellar biosynthesis GTPase FlhF